MADQRFCLKWSKFDCCITSEMDDLRREEQLVDMTLACEGHTVGVHRIVMSACSPYFKDVIKNNNNRHHLVFYMHDTSPGDLRALVEFMYKGSVNVSQTQLASFIKTAEALQIRGLSGDDDLKTSGSVCSPCPSGDAESDSGGTASSAAPHVRPSDLFSRSGRATLRAQRRSGSGSVSPEGGAAATTRLSPGASSSPVKAHLTTLDGPQHSQRSHAMANSSGDVGAIFAAAGQTSAHATMTPCLSGWSGHDVSAAAVKCELASVCAETCMITPSGDSVGNHALVTSHDHQPMDAAGRVTSHELEPIDDGRCVTSHEHEPMDDGVGARGLMTSHDHSSTSGGFDEHNSSDIPFHSGNTTIACSTCGKSFKRRRWLLAHRKVHEGKTTCALCARVYASVNELRVHLACVHHLSSQQVYGLAPRLRKGSGGGGGGGRQASSQ